MPPEGTQFSTPFRGEKNKKTRSVFYEKLNITTKALSHLKGVLN